jgi:NADPH:quinone reductase-like Zn-dependent oxidoreductase
LTRAGWPSFAALAPVISASYPLQQIVDAHRRVDAGHKQGNIIVAVTNHS